MLIIGRGVAGFGAGGEYPCVGTSAMEAANERLHHKKRIVPFICATNLPISIGVPVSTIVFF
jgi:MFS family permease